MHGVIRFAFLSIAVTLTSACYRDNPTSGALIHVLAERRADCEQLGGVLAGTWNAAIDAHVSFEDALARKLSEDGAQLLLRRISVRKDQVASLFGELGAGVRPEVRSLLLELASQTEALCVLVQNPSGFTLVSFNSKRSELRVALEASAASVALLVPPLPNSRRVAALETAVASETAALMAQLEARDEASLEALRRVEAARSEEQSRRSALDEEEKRRLDRRLELIRLERRLKAEARDASGEVQAAAAAPEPADSRRMVAGLPTPAPTVAPATEAELHQRQEQVRASKIAECQSSRDWRREWLQHFVDVARKSGRMRCKDLAAERDTVSSLVPQTPSHLQDAARDLWEKLDWLVRTCGDSAMTHKRPSVVLETEHLADYLSRIQAFCANSGLP